MPCNCKPACTGTCSVEALKAAMFSEPKKLDSGVKQQNVDAFNTIQHLNVLFREHSASDILRNGFNNKWVSIPALLLVSSVGYNNGLVKLLEVGAQVNMQNPRDGNTPLILATRGKHAATMNLLISHKAKLCIENQEGNNAFMVAVTTGSPVPVNLLWNHRKLFNIDYRNKKGYSALLLAAEKCWESCINMLLSGGANKNLVSEHGDSALAIATKANDKKSVKRLLQGNVRIITENKSGETPLCIAISEKKMDMFETIVKKMTTAEKELYVTKKLELLKRNSFIGYNSDVDYFISSLFPVFHKLLWHSSFRRHLQQQNFNISMISTLCRHVTNDDLIQRAAQLLTMTMHNGEEIEKATVDEFVQRQYPEIMVKTLEFYASTNKHTQSGTLVSLLLPVVFACTQKKGLSWLRENWYTVVSYIQVFEKRHLNLHYEENKSMVETVWKVFKERFEIIQKEKADIACAELLKTEALEKAKIEKKERKRAKKSKKRNCDLDTFQLVEASNNNASVEGDGNEGADDYLPPKQNDKPIVAYLTEGAGVSISPTSEKQGEDLADIADDEEEGDDESKSGKQKKKKRRRRKGKLKTDADNGPDMLIEDEVRVAFSYAPESQSSTQADQEPGNSNDKFEPVLSRRLTKQRRRGLVASAVDQKPPSVTGEPTLPETDSIKSNVSSKSISPLANLISMSMMDKSDSMALSDPEMPSLTASNRSPISTSVCLEKMPCDEECSQQDSPQLCVNLEEQSATLTTEKPSTPEDTVISPQVIKSDIQPEVELMEVESAEVKLAKLESADGVEEDQQAILTTPAVPTSWADLLRQKDSEFPKLGTKVPEVTIDVKKTQAIFRPPKAVVEVATLSPNARKQEKECFTLSEFILPEVARKMNIEVEKTTPSVNSFEKEDLVDSTFAGADDQLPLAMDSTATTSTHESHDSPSRDVNKENRAPSMINQSTSLFSGTCIKPPMQSILTAAIDKGQIEYFTVEEFALDELPMPKLPDPRYTNFLTDIRVPDVLPSALDEIGFLSNDSSEDELYPPKSSASSAATHTNSVRNQQLKMIYNLQMKEKTQLNVQQENNYFLSKNANSSSSVKVSAPVTNATGNVYTTSNTSNVALSTGSMVTGSMVTGSMVTGSMVTVSGTTTAGSLEGLTANGPQLHGKTNEYMTAVYHYPNTFRMQQPQRSATAGGVAYGNTASPATSYFMPYGMMMRNQQPPSNQQQGFPPNMPSSSQLLLPPPQQRVYQYSPLPNRPYNQQTLQPPVPQSILQPPNQMHSHQPKPTQYQLANKVQFQQQQQTFQQYQQQQQHGRADSAVSSSNNNNGCETGPMVWQNSGSPSVKRYEMLLWQFQSAPKEKLIMRGNIVLCMDNIYILGKSTMYGADVLVLMGKVGKCPAAVKRVPLTIFAPLRDTLQKLLLPKYQHENLVRYLEVAEDDHYGYVAQELCDFSLDEYMHILLKTRSSSLPLDFAVLFRLIWQLLKGIQALHCRCLMLHRNLKPTNIFVDSQGKLKLSDYALSHVSPEGMTMYYSGKTGDSCWRPRESFSGTQSNGGHITMVHYTMYSDIQVAAMIIYYILTGGLHAFGDNLFDIEMNIANGWPKLKDINGEMNHLLSSMLAKEPRERIDISAALRHPYFWSDKRKFEMLVAAGDELIELTNSFHQKTPAIADQLNAIALHPSIRDWAKHIDGRILEEMKLEVPQSAGTICDLLMLIHNVHHGYNKISIHLRAQLGQSHIYFMSRFSSLFMPVYKIIKSSDWVAKISFKHFFH